MGRVVVVADSSFVTKDGDEAAKVWEVTQASGDGDDSVLDWAVSGPIESPPLPGDYAVTVQIPGSDDEVIVGHIDPKNIGLASPGDVVIRARDADGNTVVTVRLASDESVAVANSSGSFGLSNDGTFLVNGGILEVKP